MRAVLWVAALVLLALPATAGEVKSITADELIAELKAKQDKVLVLDVRSDEEYAKGHVPGAVHVPYDQLESRMDEVKAQGADKVVVYCESGFRAGKAEASLQEAGVENVYDLEGHMKGWREAKRPTRRPLRSAQGE